MGAKFLRSITFVLGLCLFLASAGAAGAYGPVKKVLILPFKMNAPQDMTYLQQGILDMLSSRLEYPNSVTLVPKADAQNAFRKAANLDEYTARGLAQSMSADYVLYGTITVIGTNVSLNANFIDLAGVSQPVAVNAQSPTMDDVIPKINEFADQINASVFGRNTGGGTYTPQASPQTTASEEPVPAYQRHPDYLLTGKEGQRQLSPLNPNFIAAVGADEREGAFWRSPSLRFNITGLTVGDLDGDGLNEIAYTSEDTLFVSRMQEGRLIKLDSSSVSTGDHIVSVDIADLNGNGVPEIFVSNQRGFDAYSMVFEFQNGKLVKLAEGSQYYFRLVYTPSGPVMMGQLSGTTTLFYGGVYVMKCTNGEYTTADRISVSKEVNVFNFAMTYSDSGAGEQLLIYVNKDNRLIILGSDKDELWNSNDRFAGTPYYLNWSGGMRVDENDTKEENPRHWLPSRILVQDLNEDGYSEIILAQNEQGKASSLFDRYRYYKRGSIFSLGYVKMSLRENWRTRPLPGALTDYRITDFDNNGVRDLVVAVTMKKGDGLARAQSTIVAYELATPEEMRANQEKKMK